MRHTHLTPRERQLLKLLATGTETNRELAEAVGVVEGTIKVYMTRIYEKLKVNSRLGAAMWYERNCLYALNGQSPDDLATPEGAD